MEHFFKISINSKQGRKRATEEQKTKELNEK